jgi:hypothetical protein
VERLFLIEGVRILAIVVPEVARGFVEGVAGALDRIIALIGSMCSVT